MLRRAGIARRRSWARKDTIATWLGVAAVALLLLADRGWLPLAEPILRQLELSSINWRFGVRGAQPPTGEVVIVALDEKSVAEVGRWPWTRAKVAELVDRLAATGPKVVAFDVMFSEPEEGSAEVGRLRALLAATPAASGTSAGAELSPSERAKLSALLDRVTAGGSADEKLAAALRRAGNVILGSSGGTAAPGEKIETRVEQLAGAEFGFLAGGEEVRFALEKFPPGSFDYVNAPIRMLADSVAGVGLINYVTMADARRPGYADYCDRDGVVRRVPLAVRLGDDSSRLYMPMFLQALRVYWGLARHECKLVWGDTVVMGSRARVPMSTWGDMYINWPSAEGAAGITSGFRQIPAADVLAGRVGEGELAGKIVLVGATASGLGDLRVTPFNPVAPGVEAHAAAVDTVLNARFLQQPVWVEAVVFLLGAVLGLVFAYVLPRVPAPVAVTFTGLLTAAWLVAAQVLFLRGILVPVVLPALVLLLVPMVTVSYKFMAEQSEKVQIRDTFGRYVSPKLVDQILADPEAQKLGGRRGEVTVLFSDIRGFTTISERTEPEMLVSTLNEYLTAMTELVDQHEGTVDKFVGDAVMAVWGAPIAHPDDPMRAVRTALAMQQEVTRLQRKWEVEGRPVFRIGIGINTGSVVVGNMGSPRKMDYTVIGDNVNLASRLESLNKEHGTTVIISAFTYERVKEFVQVRRLGEAKVKGKETSVEIFELMGLAGAAPVPA